MANVYRSIEEFAERKSSSSRVLTIGNFDGVHLGHQHLIRSTLDMGERLNAHPLLLTFEPHPQKVLRGEPPPLISSLRQKLTWIEELGIEEIIVHPFTPEFSCLSPEEFLELIRTAFSPLKGMAVGYDFRFGKGGVGDLKYLREWGSRCGIEIRTVPAWTLQGKTVSSSYIRQLLAQGDVGQVRLLLGRPWQLWGKPGKGMGRGKTLGFPTINLVPENPLIVADGVYGGRLRSADSLYLASISVGTNPTFGEEPRHVEVHLLGFQGELRSQEHRVEFFTFIRSQVRFPQITQLIAQIETDVAVIQEQARRERWLDLP